jgi:hypothetical protein
VDGKVVTLLVGSGGLGGEVASTVTVVVVEELSVVVRATTMMVRLSQCVPLFFSCCFHRPMAISREQEPSFHILGMSESIRERNYSRVGDPQ